MCYKHKPEKPAAISIKTFELIINLIYLYIIIYGNISSQLHNFNPV